MAMDRGLIIGENKAARAVLETLRGPNHQPTLSEVRQMATHSLRACAHCGNSFAFRSSASRHCSAECRFRDIASAFSGEGCWEWPLSRNKKTGYGQFTLKPVPAQVLVTAHRMSYSLFIGNIPDGHCVMHKCDNRGCFNPAHLDIGTIGDNNRDMVAKGRHAGATRPKASACLAGHAKKQMPSGRWKCLDCEMLRKREQRAALRGGAPCGGRGRPGVPRREVSQTTSRNRAP